MMTFKVELDRRGIRRLLGQDGVARMVNTFADQVARQVETQLPGVTSDPRSNVNVDPYTTDRRAAMVYLNHPDAVGLEAKYGLIARASASAGVAVTEKS